MFTSFKGCVITSSGITFLTYPGIPFTSECVEKRGGSPPQNQIPQPSFPRSCSNCIRSYNTEAVEEFVDDFSSSVLYFVLLEVPQIGPIIAPEYLYNLLSFGNIEIDDILSKLAK